MSRLATVNLMDLFSLYLVVAFILGTVMRYRQYRAIVSLVLDFPQRWPKLTRLAQQHRTVFLRWPTLLPIAVTFAVMLAHLLAYQFVWTQARVTPLDLWHYWPALICLVVFLVPMLYLDATATFDVAHIDRPGLEKNLDQAEYWLGSWVAGAVRVLTFGFVNPRRTVHEEVGKALAQAMLDLNRMMWRWALQIAMRLAFGLTLWFTWALAVRTQGQ